MSTKIEPLGNIKITYQHAYDEALNKAKDMIELCKVYTLPQKQVEVLLTYFIEYSQMWYKVKCVAMEKCIEQFADTANGYAKGVELLKNRIIELTKPTEVG